ncbi:MAG: GntR family transcriptional regulator [Deltaproteobacteria bacterium]|nr:GntR family transcriptional regulator [Deltaproteobacteria bacterium]
MKKLKKNQPIMPKVVDILRNAIIEGELNPGERINETAIALKLGISRSPVREAIKVLESENLVQTFNLRGSFVKDLSKKEVEDLYMVNSLIHRAAIRVAIERMDSRREKILKKLIGLMNKAFESADDIDKKRLLARQFHRFIIEATGNDLLLKIHDSLRTQEERFRYYTLQAGSESLAEGNREHIAIAEALLKRDAGLAESIINTHFDRARLRVLENIRKP